MRMRFICGRIEQYYLAFQFIGLQSNELFTVRSLVSVKIESTMRFTENTHIWEISAENAGQDFREYGGAGNF